MRSKLCRKVSAQINIPNRLESILSLKTKESLYRSFILPNFYHCNHVWHHCGKRNTTKIEKVNGKALRYVYNNKHASYQHLLERIRLPPWNLEEFKTCYWQNIKVSRTKHHRQLEINLINLRSFKYNLKRQEYVLSLPKVKTIKYGLKSWRYFAAKKWNELSNDIRIKVDTIEEVSRIRLLNFGD